MYGICPEEENQGNRTTKTKGEQTLQVKKTVLMLREKGEGEEEGLKTTY